MTASATDVRGTPRDPVERLEQRIDRARREAARPPAEEPVDAPSDDPIEELLARIEEGHPERALQESSGPLAELDARIRRAASTTAVSRPPTRTEEDPLDHLRAVLEDEMEAIGRRAAVQTPRNRARPLGESESSGEVEAAVGREVLAMIRDRPLPGEVRELAVRRM
ncbi:MAG: hypothetical protein ABEL76_16535, partial [Bradymonadaceae bacterium]